MKTAEFPVFGLLMTRNSCLLIILVPIFAGFIDFIVEPTFSGLVDTAEKVIGPLIEEERKAKETGNRRSRYCDTQTSPIQPMSSAQVQEPL